jgi:hypothetical protein
MLSSEPTVAYKRSAPDAPDTSDDDGSQPERGKEAEAADPKLDQAEEQKAEAGWRSSQSVSRGAQDDGHHAAEPGDGANGESCPAWSLLNSA